MRSWWNRALLAFIIALTVFSFIVVWPSEPNRYLPNFVPWPEGKGIKMPFISLEGGVLQGITIERRAMRLGLDLKGGSRIVLEADTSGAPGVNVSDAVEAAGRIIERRVNAFGVAESEIQTQGRNRLAVQLPGIDPEEARDLVGRTALLEFREAKQDETGAVITCDGEVSFSPPACDGEEMAVALQLADRGQIVWVPATAAGDEEGGVERKLTGRFLQANTFVSFDIVGQPVLNFEMTSEGSGLLEEVTTRLQGYPLAFFLDGEPIRGDDDRIIAPTVQATISSRGTITGLLAEDARILSIQLNAGAFPLPMKVVQQEEVDATLGEDSVKASVIAGEVALFLVMLFMVLYYRLPGVLASLALVVYTAAVLMVFKMWPVTLTLAGIGAFILSVGMAVDANILIFERMKEELRLGRSLVAAIDTGFSRAWTSIRDSNVSTLITCAILFWFGDQFGASLVKGFALTLAFGVIISMFSAIAVTRTFLRIAAGTPLARRLSLWVVDAGQVRGVAEVVLPQWAEVGAPARRPE